MKQDKVRLFIFTLILLLAITVYSIYQENKNKHPQESSLSSPTSFNNGSCNYNI
ncbi:hypothetical protein [Alkaliphilus hydrothermalis]|uniref:Uncharacterized protein n=1 Tax=Alkaliphilus hydrothermalis TaxID=1482730 RepID=A0ABS2NSM4_9FIRM|nr:hypothetical protein [Alkaliphilus hydrothermalis]MBM7615960.1 hypothetical protein [Alkaliphilus hydrothermalis]